MTYELEFVDSALKEWRKLDPPIRKQFKAKLRERQENPRVIASALSGMPDCYKIKLRSSGFRLAYKVEDSTVTVLVLAVGKLDKDTYKNAASAIPPAKS